MGNYPDVRRKAMKYACLCLVIVVALVTLVPAEEPAAQPSKPALLAGAREVQITPTRDREKVHQDMYARSLVVSDGQTRVAIITLDYGALGYGPTTQVRKGIEEATGIPAGNVTINCSHTHNGTWPEGEWEDGLSYGDWLVKVCIELTTEANDALEPAAIGYDRIPIQIGFNRRLVQDDGQVTMAINPAGPVAAWTDVIAINTTERPGRVGVFFTYAAHPVITQFTDVVSSDYPGSAIARLKKLLGDGGTPETGGVFMFGQGCGANINGFPLRGGPEACDAVGAKLANALLRGNLEGVPKGDIRVEWLIVTLPFQKAPSVAELEKALEERPDDERLAKRLALVKAGKMPQSLPYPMMAIAIGPDLCILSLPYETFVEYQIFADEASQFAHTVTLGYCLAGPYVGTATAYEMGDQAGYEAYGNPTGGGAMPLEPGAERIVQDGIVELLGKLKQDDDEQGSTP
jgi:neutral ceramidase